MRNRALHDALRDFALEAASLLTDELRDGAELEFDVISDSGGRGPALYRYKPRIEVFLAERWDGLRELPACTRAARELGSGAAIWLRASGTGAGLSGEQAEPALRAMLERLYDDATSFGFPEERFERVYAEVEMTLYRDAVRARVVAPLRGAVIEADRVDLGGGLSLVRGDLADAPPEAVWPDPLEAGDEQIEPTVLCVLERDAPADEGITAGEAARRFAGVVTALRLWAPGAVVLGAPGWRRTDEGRWQPLSLGTGGEPPNAGPTWFLAAGDEPGLRELHAAVERADPPQAVAWALARFEMGCARGDDSEALSDYLLGLRALLDAASDAGQASLALRVAALCAEEDRRKLVQRRLEAATALERFVMGSGPRVRFDEDSPRELVAEVEGHLRALVRDVLCGYLDADLRGIADDILLEAEPVGEIIARDLRREAPPRGVSPETVEPDTFEPDTFEPELEAYDLETSEMEALAAEPEREQVEANPDAVAPDPDPEPDPDAEVAFAPLQTELEGVTASADWGWGEPEDYSGPM